MKLKYTNYLHFDNKMSIKEAKIYLKDISNHQYLPFINYNINKNKWNKNHEYIKDYRTISVCSHKDNYVYQYFNNKINPKYEKYIKKNQIAKCVYAFRKGIGCNINFAGDILNYIKEQKNCYVLVADINKFFDNLDHQILKTNLKKVLNTESLNDNTYKMLKSLMKPSYLNIDDIYQILKKSGIYIEIDEEYLNEVGNKAIWEKINQFGNDYKWNTIITKEMFKKYKKEYLKPLVKELKEKNKGIAQGSPISGTLSNIYMLDFDIKINKLVNNLNGKYLRYCDDFIIAIPNYNQEEFLNLIDTINTLIKDIKLEIKEEKLQIFKYENNSVINLNNKVQKDKIQFLGFELKNNKIIDIRISTKQRNNNKILRRIKKQKNIKKQTNKKIDKTIIYDKTVTNGAPGDYKNYTFGNYQSKAAKVIGGKTLKMSIKKTIEFINKHCNK